MKKKSKVSSLPGSTLQPHHVMNAEMQSRLVGLIQPKNRKDKRYRKKLEKKGVVFEK